MTTLFFCNTNYQLIVAIQMASTIKMDSSVVLTNEIKGLDKIVNNLSGTKIFKHVWTVDVKSDVSTLKNFFYLIFGKLLPIPREEQFDEIIGFNLDIPTHWVYARCYRKNKNIRVSKMEEGLLSYNTPDTTCRVLEWAYKVRHFFSIKNLKDEMDSFYCFLPKAYSGPLKTQSIPRIKNDDNRIKQILNQIFVDKPLNTYDERYIFLSCIYDIEGGEPIGELELAKKMAKVVGSENLLVKVHPRDDKGKYIQAGLKVDNNSSVPFEVIQINNDFSDKILITTLSGSILNFNPVLESPPASYYGYKLCNLDANPLAAHYREVVEGYLASDDLGLRNIRVIDSVEEILNG